jgi:hypothetical protein
MTRYRFNKRDVVFEEVEGEVILIDLARGCYFSLSGSGPVVWGMLGGGASVEEVCEALTNVEAEREQVESLVEQLAKESLILPTADEEAGEAPGVGAPNGASFEKPVLEKYEDLKDYFLIDPIHEVDESAGWPNRRPD